MGHTVRFDGGPHDGEVKEIPEEIPEIEAYEVIENTSPNLQKRSEWVTHVYKKSTTDPHIYWYAGSKVKRKR